MRVWTRFGAPLAIAAGIAVGLAIALLLRAERRLAEPSRVLHALSASLGHRVEAEDVGITYWPPGVLATGVHVADESPLGPGSLVRADELELRVSTWGLLRGRLVVDEVRLLRPAVRLVRGDDGRWNTERRRRSARIRGERGPPRAPGVEVEIDTLRVRDGRIRYRDRALAGATELEVDELNLLARRDDGISADFNASALGGGPESFVGSVQIPPLGVGKDVEIELRGAGLEAARIPELLAILQIPIPFAVELGGRLGLQARAAVSPIWPAARGRVRLGLDGTETTISAARGWLAKAAETPAHLRLELDRDSGAWWLERALLETTGIRLSARVDALVEEPGAAPAGTKQPPLRFAAESIRVEDLSAWFPVLADLSPTGQVDLDGRLEPTGEAVAVDLGSSGGPLRLRAGGRGIAAASAALRVRAEPRRVHGHATLSGVSLGAVSAAGLHIAIDGVPDGPMDLFASATAPGRGPIRLDAVDLAGTIEGGRLDLPWIEATGLGGSLSGRAAVRSGGGDMVATFEPRWEQIDAGALFRLLGLEERLLGILSGRATLFARGGDATELATSLGANLGGEFEVHLEDGLLIGLNPGRALIDELSRLPGLRGPIEQRARTHAPELLAGSAEIDSLYARGSIARGDVTVDALSIATDAYHVEASGQADFDGQIELAGRLGVAAALQRSLVPRAGRLWIGSSSGDGLSVPLSVRGDWPGWTVAVGSETSERRRGGGLLERWLRGVP